MLSIIISALISFIFTYTILYFTSIKKVNQFVKHGHKLFNLKDDINTFHVYNSMDKMHDNQF
jgi:hypothetical protein